MSDGLDIRGGGVIAVDTASLRRAAGRLGDLVTACDRIRDLLAGTTVALTAGGLWAGPPTTAAARVVVDGEEIVAALREMAETYEYVDLMVRRDAAVARGDVAGATALQARLERFVAAHPGESEAAVAAWQRWREHHADPLRGQLLAGSLVYGTGVGALGGTLLSAVPLIGAGRVSASDRLVGAAPAVAVSPIRREPVAPPASLAALTARMPGAGDSRVRVERYRMPDGSRQFVAYIAGTAGGISAAEAWDNRSNLALYFGRRSASSEATVAALRQSGARRGDTVRIVGHSQGAMVGTRLALESRYRVPLLVTLGSPVAGEVGRETLSVALRHTDDPVVALSDGGHAGAVGAPGSFIAERVADPMPFDLGLGAHGLEDYTRTADLLDASTDPRMDAVRADLAGLAEASEADAVVYGATRLDPPSADARLSASAEAGG